MHKIRSILAAGSLCTAPALAGPLNPPAGPISESGRFGPRIEINDSNTPGDADSVYRISQPGSYYLSGNLTGQGGKHGIEIAANGVTVDLMGYELSGLNSSLSGISGAGFSITVRNGSIRGFGEHGVFMESSLSSIIENIQVAFVGGGSGEGVGILVGPYARISGCSVNGPQGDCFRGAKGCVVESCIASTSFSGNGFSFAEAALITSCFANQCDDDGFRAGEGSVFTGCTAEANEKDGIAAGARSVVIGCASHGNGQNGLSLSLFCVVAMCTATGNGFDGVAAGSSSIESCTAAENGEVGINAGGQSVVRGCFAYDNGSTGISTGNASVVEACSSWFNTDVGIIGGFGSYVARCTARSNGDGGISMNSRSRVSNSLASNNNQFGIRIDADSEALDCAVNDNAGPGILQRSVGLTYCRIEGNSITKCTTAIELTGERNVVVRNMYAGNTSEIVGPVNNTVGEQINAAGVILNNSNSWANIRY